jgi:hypothetical protein
MNIPLPETSPNSDIYSNVPTMGPPTPESYSETEQFSPELAQVESSQKIEPFQQVAADTETESTEPSAVYNEATGELDILHHHSVAPLAPPTESDPSYLQINQPPDPIESPNSAPPVNSNSSLPPQIPLPQPPLAGAQ